MLYDDLAFAGSKSASSGSTIIGENTGVFIGGLPENFALLREDPGKTTSTSVLCNNVIIRHHYYLHSLFIFPISVIWVIRVLSLIFI